MLAKAQHINIGTDDKFVVFSDLHIGDGRSLDDFKNNSDLFYLALKEYYWNNSYTLILNGDVEELHRYALHRIRDRWTHLYELFDLFYKTNRFFKNLGNHDSKLFSFPDQTLRYPLHDSLVLKYSNNTIFLLHGHQVSMIYENYNTLMGLFLRYIANPLRIKHYSAAFDNHKKFSVEKKVYDFARENRLIAIIGHTHRPLFESMSKIDTLNYQIERLLRKYQNSTNEERETIESQILSIKDELKSHTDKGSKEATISSVYSSHTIIPCLFNSGPVIGYPWMTAIEISEGEIRLVQWLKAETNGNNEIGISPYQRKIIKTDSLDYIFNRIRLLV